MKHFTKAVGSLLCVVALTLTCFGGCVNQNSPGNSSSGTSKTESTTFDHSGNTSSVSENTSSVSENTSSVSDPGNSNAGTSSTKTASTKPSGASSGAPNQEDDFDPLLIPRILQFDNTGS